MTGDLSAGPTGLVVPAYFHPALAAADWAALAAAADRVRLVVLNVASGSGDQRDSAFVDVVARVRDAGVSVAGYVDTAYGRKPSSDALRELTRYQDWYGADSVFYDRAASGVEYEPHYRALAASSRSLGARLVAFNHGTHPARDYAEDADLLGTFEGPWPAFLAQDVPSWVHDYPAGRFFNLMYDTPPALAAEMHRIALERNIGAMYRTERGAPNPWAALPSNFPNNAIASSRGKHG